MVPLKSCKMRMAFSPLLQLIKLLITNSHVCAYLLLSPNVILSSNIMTLHNSSLVANHHFFFCKKIRKQEKKLLIKKNEKNAFPQ